MDKEIPVKDFSLSHANFAKKKPLPSKNESGLLEKQLIPPEERLFPPDA